MNDCAKGLLQAAIGTPLAIGLAIGSGSLVRGTHADAASLPSPTAHAAPHIVGAGAVTIYTSGNVEYYSGRFDVASTHARRVEFHADDYSGGAGKPPSGQLDDGYEVTVYAADGVAFGAEDCALVGVDRMGESEHWYLRCD